MKPTLPELLQQAVEAFDRNRGDLAESILRRVLEQKPDHWYAVTALSAAFRLQRRYDAALDQARRALAMHPNQPYAHFTLGIVLAHLEEYPPAIKHALQAIRLAPERPRYYLLLSNAYHNSGRYDEAVVTAEEGLRHQADYQFLHRQRTVALAGAGRVADAEAALVEVFRAAPDAYGSMFAAGWMHWILKNYEIAIEYMRRALQKAPMSADSHGLLGLSLFSLGRHAEARPELVESLRLRAYNKDCRDALAEIDRQA